jgi:hypothetical protein
MCRELRRSLVQGELYISLYFALYPRRGTIYLSTFQPEYYSRCHLRLEARQ